MSELISSSSAEASQKPKLCPLGYPLLFEASRKGFIGQLLNGLPPTERVEGTVATNMLAIAREADILRVHTVQAAYRSGRIVDAIVR